MKTRVIVRYFVTDCLWKQFFDFNSLQMPLNLIFWTVLVILRTFTLSEPKVRATKFQKRQKFLLLDNCFSDLFTEVKILY